jgi:hypothetical protein
MAQDHPDLSGRWILDNVHDASSDAAVELTVQQVERTTSALGRPLAEPVTFLTVERRSAAGIRIDRYEPVGVVGGVVEGLSGQPGTLTTTMGYSTKWDGAVLVITRTERGETRDERWSLEAGGILVLTTTTRANGSESKIRLVYRKQ